jgi:hypothetical protein
MSEASDFTESADEQTIQWTGLIRRPVDNPGHGQNIQFVATSEDFEHEGLTLFSVASAGGDLGHVALSIHAFVDGVRVAPDVMTVGDELFITIKNA